jgi:hypothetical protein
MKDKTFLLFKRGCYVVWGWLSYAYVILWCAYLFNIIKYANEIKGIIITILSVMIFYMIFHCTSNMCRVKDEIKKLEAKE